MTPSELAVSRSVGLSVLWKHHQRNTRTVIISTPIDISRQRLWLGFVNVVSQKKFSKFSISVSPVKFCVICDWRRLIRKEQCALELSLSIFNFVGGIRRDLFSPYTNTYFEFVKNPCDVEKIQSTSRRFWVCVVLTLSRTKTTIDCISMLLVKMHISLPFWADDILLLLFLCLVVGCCAASEIFFVVASAGMPN